MDKSNPVFIIDEELSKRIYNIEFKLIGGAYLSLYDSSLISLDDIKKNRYSLKGFVNYLYYIIYLFILINFLFFFLLS